MEVFENIAFQLTTSRRGRRRWKAPFPGRRPFNSRPHAEVDYFCRTYMCCEWTFNSRPHAEVDHCVRFHSVLQQSFNSRPHAEVDLLPEYKSYTVSLSTHDLTQRSTIFELPEDCRTYLSTHDLTQRSTVCSGECSGFCSFQLTTSRRGRRSLKLIMPTMQICFQLTTSRRGRR